RTRQRGRSRARQERSPKAHRPIHRKNRRSSGPQRKRDHDGLSHRTPKRRPPLRCIVGKGRPLFYRQRRCFMALRSVPECELTGLSILIVEDDPLLRKQLAAELEQAGADVTGAETLSTGQRWLGEMSFDFVLLDVNLPDGIGTDLLKTKAIPSQTATIVMTADGGVRGAVA